MNNITPATHSYKACLSLARCKTCKKKQTTGRIKDLKTGKVEPFCSDCAVKKGFQ